jgi:hypothetical protein
MANPGRRLAEARKLQRAKRLADPLYLALLRERFGKSTWWVTTRPELVDSALAQGIRRRALSEAIDGDEIEEAI